MSRACFYHMRDLCRIGPVVDFVVAAGRGGMRHGRHCAGTGIWRGENKDFRNLTTSGKSAFYQNWLSFVDDVTKSIWCVFGFAVATAVYLQNANAKFLKVV